MEYQIALGMIEWELHYRKKQAEIAGKRQNEFLSQKCPICSVDNNSHLIRIVNAERADRIDVTIFNITYVCSNRHVFRLTTKEPVDNINNKYRNLYGEETMCIEKNIQRLYKNEM